jgi:hypothetical protein
LTISTGHAAIRWSTTDGSKWALELSEDQYLAHVDGADIEGRSIGIWVGFGGETEETVQAPVVTTTPSVVTTTAVMPDEPVDPDGLEFQAAVTEDGTVTFEEFGQAAEHWKTCMEEHGVTNVEYTIRAPEDSARHSPRPAHGEVGRMPSTISVKKAG